MTVLFHIALVNTGTVDMLPLCFCYHGTEIMEQIKKLFWQTFRKKSTSSAVFPFSTLEKSMSIVLSTVEFENFVQQPNPRFFALKDSGKQYFHT